MEQVHQRASIGYPKSDNVTYDIRSNRTSRPQYAVRGRHNLLHFAFQKRTINVPIEIKIDRTIS